MTDKLPFKFAERGTVLPIKMDRDKWLALAKRNNLRRSVEGGRYWYLRDIEDFYAVLHPA